MVNRKNLLPLVVLFLFLTSAVNAGTVNFVGSYSNVESGDEGEHCSGYDIDLYEHEGSTIGNVSYSSGLCGDSPFGLLNEVKHEKKQGSLLFESKLSVGEDAKGRTKDILKFKGVLTQSSLSGVMSWFTYGSNKPYSEEKVKVQKIEKGWVVKSLDFEEWKKSQQELLKFRGPKW